VKKGEMALIRIEIDLALESKSFTKNPRKNKKPEKSSFFFSILLEKNRDFILNKKRRTVKSELTTTSE
jgi:hypothetical protein